MIEMTKHQIKQFKQAKKVGRIESLFYAMVDARRGYYFSLYSVGYENLAKAWLNTELIIEKTDGHSGLEAFKNNQVLWQITDFPLLFSYEAEDKFRVGYTLQEGISKQIFVSANTTRSKLYDVLSGKVNFNDLFFNDDSTEILNYDAKLKQLTKSYSSKQSIEKLLPSNEFKYDKTLPNKIDLEDGILDWLSEKFEKEYI